MKVRNASSALKVKVGNVSDFPSIDQDRETARQLVQTMIATKRNPNKIKRETDASELTMSEVFAQYRQHLLGRSKPAKPNTLNVLNKAEERFSAWSGLSVKDLSGNAILGKFDEIANRGRTAAEQTFRWATIAVSSVKAVCEGGMNTTNGTPIVSMEDLTFFYTSLC